MASEAEVELVETSTRHLQVNFSGSLGKASACIHIASGVLCAGGQAAAMYVKASASGAQAGMWAAGMVTCYLVACVLSVIFGALPLAASSMGMYADLSTYRENTATHKTMAIVLAANGSVLVVAGLHTLFCMVVSCVCCNVLCSSSKIPVAQGKFCFTNPAMLNEDVTNSLHTVSNGVFYVQDECRKTNPFFIDLYSHSGTITLESQSTNIYTGKYCTLFIRASGSYKLMVKIEKFDLAGSYGHCSSSPDTVRIYDAEKANSSSDHLLTRLMCGNMTGYPNLYSDTGIIQIEFFAHDNFGQHSGFRFVVSEVDNSHHEWPIYMQKVCNLTNPYRVTDKISGYLYSNNGPGLYYHGNMDCGVVITVDKGLTLGFIVQWMDIRMGSSCTDGGDYLRVYQGDSASGEALTQRMCGFRSKHVTTSTKTNQIFVRFHTSDGGVIPFSGFVLRFYIYTVTEETSSDPNIGAIIAGFAFCIAVIFFILLRVCKEPECRPKCRHAREGSRHRQVAPSRESRPQTYNQNRQTAEARNRSETRPVISSFFRAAPSSPSSTTITRSHSIPSGPDVEVASPTTPSTRTDTIPTAPTAPSSVTPRAVTRRPRPDSPPPSYQPQPYEPPPSYDSLFPNT